MGRSDAFNGSVLLGNGRGEFRTLSLMESGLCVPGDAKALVSSVDYDGQLTVIASVNRGGLKAFSHSLDCQKIIELPDDVYRVELEMKDGKKGLKEFYFGSGFLSQSGRRFCIGSNVVRASLLSFKNTRTELTIQ
jgi:enediyne biosynthesis protein E4